MIISTRFGSIVFFLECWCLGAIILFCDSVVRSLFVRLICTNVRTISWSIFTNVDVF